MVVLDLPDIYINFTAMPLLTAGGYSFLNVKQIPPALSVAFSPLHQGLFLFFIPSPFSPQWGRCEGAG